MISEREAARREVARRAFLDAAGLGAARREPLAGDASTRAYERLHPPSGPSLILMDQPPALETQPCPPDASEAERAALGFNAAYRLAAGRVDAFVACAAHLRGLGLSAPEIVAAEPGAGFAVLEDLGDDLYATVIAAGAEEAPLYDSAVDVLLRLHAAAPPAVLKGEGVSWPLLSYDALALRTAGALFTEWLPRLDPRLVFAKEALQEWRALWTPIVERGEAGASVFCQDRKSVV